METISIIVPVWNEEKNIEPLIGRIHAAFRNKNLYKIIFVDDHSTDNTVNIINRLKKSYPVALYIKKGKKGKAYSLYEGINLANSDYVAILDADLQYPPEAIPEMMAFLQYCDIVVANRSIQHTSIVRKFISSSFKNIFGKMLFGMSYDIQAGLKVFKKSVFSILNYTPSSGWTFDLEFLHKAKNAGFKIKSFDIVFEKRKFGKSKVSFLKTSLEIGLNALSVRTKNLAPVHIPPEARETMKGAGVGYKKHTYITHSTLNHAQSALKTLIGPQKVFIGLVVLSVLTGLIFKTLTALQIIIGILSFIYFLDVLFNLFLVLKSLHHPQEIISTDEEISKLKDSELPIYSILCPLYKEAHVIPHFLESIDKLDYPKEKLDVLLLLEEDDKETIKKVEEMNLPTYVRQIIVPNSLPKTKPKACNYGLAFAIGAYLVIYDAEDMPDPFQLKKAYLGFKKAGKDVVCLQAKLNYYNPHQNILTRFFTAEYSLWFDVTLTGLQAANTGIPLGGTSNHFRTHDLQNLEGWDPFNVTEDADLGIRLFKKGFKTAIIDSVTLEEANSRVYNWIRQRSRWIKGYMQTYLVHTRKAFGIHKKSIYHTILFHLNIGGKIAFILINPLLWIATISYFVLYKFVGTTIESLYPTYIFYMAAFSLVAGNFLFVYYYMIGCAKRNHWELIKYVYFVPFYWILISFSGFVALYQLVFRPHYWEKTVHGLHFGFEEKIKQKEIMKLASASRRAARLSRLVDIASSSFVGGGILVAGSVIGNFLNFLYNAYLGRSIPLEEFGIISLVGSFIYISQVPLGALSRTVSHKSAHLLGQFNTPIKKFWKETRRKSFILALGVTVVWLILTPLLQSFFKIESAMPFILFTPVWIIGTLTAVDGGFLRGNLNFKILALIGISEAVTKLILTVLLVKIGLSDYVYAAIPLSMTVSFSIGWWKAQNTKSKQEKIVNLNKSLTFPKSFFITSNIANLTSIAYLSLDLVLAKHYLSPTDAGNYSFLTLVGKMVFFFGTLLSQFIVPVVSRDIGAGKNPKHSYNKIILAISGFSLLSFAAFGVLGFITVPILWGPKSLNIVSLLPLYTFAMVCFSISSSIISYQQIKKKNLFPVVGLFLGAGELVGIFFFHQTILMITEVVALSGILSLIVIFLLDKFYNSIINTYRNTIDLIGLFEKVPAEPLSASGKLRILIFNWRDLKHKWAGGAEVYIHELARRWVSMGNEVTIFCGNDGRSSKYEIMDGVRIIRRGGTYFVYLWAFLYYIFKLRGKYDVVIDSENGIPFFTPLYVKKPIFLLIHHIHQEVFRKSLKPPFSTLAEFLELKAMPIVYKDIQIITVSPSSKDEIMRHKLTSKEPIIIYNGVDTSMFKPGSKSEKPMILYLGRLKYYKSLNVYIKAAKKILEKIPDVEFIIAGEGEERARLEKYTKKLNLENKIRFIGKVSFAQKVELLQKAWVFVNPSFMEGWGLTTLEANACGTPTVASDVPGLRDSIKNPHTGFLVSYGDADEFAKKCLLLIKSYNVRKTMSKASVNWAKNFDWDKNSLDLVKYIKNSLLKKEII